MRKTKASANLFSEFFRQELSSGIFMTVVSAVLGAVYALMQFRLLGDMEGDILNVLPREGTTLLDASQMVALLAFAWCFILSLRFQFYLNKKENIDFYLALPVKREHLLLQYLGATYVWGVILFLVGALFAGLTTALFTSAVLLPGSIVRSVLGALTAMLFLTASAAIGVAVSGNGLNALFIGIAVAVGPRLTLYCFHYFPGASVFSLDAPSGLPFLTPRMNTFLDILWLMNSDGYSSTEIALTNRNVLWVAILWTTLVSLLYGAVALFFMKKRTGEMGGTKAGVHAAMFGVVYGLNLFTVKAFLELKYQSYAYTEDENTFLYTVLFFLFGTLVLFFVYERLFQKQWKKTVKSLWVYGAALLLDLILFGALVLSTNVRAGYHPQAQDIQKISITTHTVPTDRSAFFRDGGLDTTLSDPEAKALVAKALNRSPAETRKVWENSFVDSVEVGVTEGNKTRYRQIAFTDKEYRKLGRLLEQKETLINGLRRLPSGPDLLSTSLDSGDLHTLGVTLTSEEKQTLLTKVQRDWKAMSADCLLVRSDVFNAEMGTDPETFEENPYILYLSAVKNNSPYTVPVDIVPDMKESYGYLTEIFGRENKRSAAKLLKTLSEDGKDLMKQLKAEDCYLFITTETVVYNEDIPEGYYEENVLSDSFQDTGISMKALSDYLKTLEVMTKGRDPLKKQAKITVGIYDYTKDGRTHPLATGIFLLPDNKIPSFLAPYMDIGSFEEDVIEY